MEWDRNRRKYRKSGMKEKRLPFGKYDRGGPNRVTGKLF
jgi:hypothetical protein